MKRNAILRSISMTALFVLAGCGHLGPKTITVDRFDYGTTVAESWKQQTLLNIVKLRYLDLPVFVDVASIVSGYSIQTGFNINGTASADKEGPGNFASAGGQVIYTDRPTITYVPVTGEKFLRGLITPIDPKNIFFMLQAGYQADFILGLTVEGMNGVRNSSVSAGTPHEADPEFIRALQLLREVQAASAFGMCIEEEKAKGAKGVIFFRQENVPADIQEKLAEIRRLLKLPSEGQKYTLSYSPVRGATNELAVNSRSMLQIMGALAGCLDVPAEHLKDHSAVPAFENATAASRHDALRIRSGKEKPRNAFAAVPYRGYWFWVGNGDLNTKRALMAIMFFFTLAETGDTGKLPLITIPAQ